MVRSFSIAVFLVLTTFSGAANAACPDPSVRRIVDDAKWCFGNATQDARNDLLSACARNAKVTHDGFFSCQGDSGPQNNYDSCDAGQQIDAVRAALAELGSPCTN